MSHRAVFVSLTSALGLLSLLAASDCFAQDPAMTIKERQGLMKLQAENLKAIQGYVSGETNRDTALAKVSELMTLPPKIQGLFPPGTSIVEFPKETHAKPEIWQQWSRFKEVPSVLLRVEQKLAEAVKGGTKQDVLEQLDAVGRSGCGACHTLFRAPLKE
jgi:cytochrome c556